MLHHCLQRAGDSKHAPVDHILQEIMIKLMLLLMSPIVRYKRCFASVAMHTC